MGKKNNKIVIILMGVIIVILAVLCVLFATDTISFNTKTIDDNDAVGESNSSFEEKDNKNVNNKDNSIVGEYFYVTNDEIESERVLDLMPDGTFYYFTGATCANIGSGKYEISERKLKLNFSFLMNCGGELYMKENSAYSNEINVHSEHLTKQIEYIINDDNSLSLSTDINKTIVKTSNDYEHLYYYNDNIISIIANMMQNE